MMYYMFLLVVVSVQINMGLSQLIWVIVVIVADAVAVVYQWFQVFSGLSFINVSIADVIEKLRFL